jgi:spore germination cell wall hydrolase CwlJ-like protein
MFAGLFLTGFANIYTYAAEEGNVVTEETTINNEADTVTGTTTVPTEAADVTNEDDANTEETVQEATDDTTEEKVIETDDKVDDVKATTKTEAKKTIKKTATKETTKETAKKTVAKETTKKTTVKKETVNYTKAELRLLSTLIYCEANAESYNGKLAVAIVVMNRVRSGAFPDSVKDVIYQKYQFGPVSNGSLSKQLAAYDAGNYTNSYELECIKAAKEALNGAKDITVNGKSKDFGKYLFFSGRLKNASFNLGHHQFK